MQWVGYTTSSYIFIWMNKQEVIYRELLKMNGDISWLSLITANNKTIMKDVLDKKIG